MQTTKFKIDYNETTEQPELVFTFNTASEEVLDKLLKRFHELAITPTKKIASTRYDSVSGISMIILRIEDL